jgi:hypothetical protein
MKPLMNTDGEDGFGDRLARFRRKAHGSAFKDLNSILHEYQCPSVFISG